MKHIILGAWALLFLSFAGCGDPGASTGSPATNPEVGGHASDNTVQPNPSTGGKTHPYSEQDNLLDPNFIEFVFSPDRSKEHPFNAPFIQAQNIRTITFSHYNSADNTLSETDAEGQLESSGTKTYEFDGQGRLARWENIRLMDGTPLQNVSVTNHYNSSGQLASQDIAQDLSGIESSGSATYTYDEKGRSLARVDPLGVSMYYGYDETDAPEVRKYELQSTPGGGNSVHVYGIAGTFPNPTALKMQDEILSLGSPFVPYAKAPGIIRNVFFYEKTGRRTVLQLNMGKNGEIDGKIIGTYNKFENVVNARLNWDDEGALFKSERVVHYLPSNDLDRMVVKQLRQEGESKTTIYRFTYGATGLLEKLVEVTRIDNNPEVIESIDFVRYETGQPLAQPGEAVPGGAN